MGKPVNLNRYRKEKARADKKARADQNAAKFGQSKKDKTLARLRREKQDKTLDNHELDE